MTDANHLPDPTRLVPGNVPPNDLDAEGYILSAVLMEPGELDRCIAVGLDTVHWYADANRRIWESIVRLNDLHEGIDLTSVAGDLRLLGRLDQVGGTPYLAQFANFPAQHSGMLEQHCRTVITHWRARQTIAVAQVAVASLYHPNGTPAQTLIESLETQVWELAHSNRESGYEGAGLIAARALGVLADALRDGKSLLGNTTGFSDLDKQTTGWHPGELTILAARPGMGKTACACSMILNMTPPPPSADDEEALPDAVYFHSCEMPREDIALRLVCSLAGVEFKKLRLNQLQRGDWDKLFLAVNDLSRRAIFIDDRPAVTVAEFRSNIRKIQREIELKRTRARKLVLAAIDYLQLMRGEQGQGREREISSISQGLKNTAKIEKVPVLALAQLNRDLEKGGKDKRPKLKDLRESGSIEQDADNVLFIYREGYYNKEANNEAEIIIEKQRNGPTCTVLLAFDGPTTTFRPLARGYEEFSDFGDDPSESAGPGHWQDGDN